MAKITPIKIYNGNTYYLKNDKGKKYELGDKPCGNCNLHHHKKCRPRMDGEFCSCNCPRSTALQGMYEEYLSICEANCKQPLSFEELYDLLKGKLRANNFKDFTSRQRIQLTESDF